jgi:hypothetical protein
MPGIGHREIIRGIEAGKARWDKAAYIHLSLEKMIRLSRS